MNYNYILSRNIPESNSPNTVWLLRDSSGYIGIDYHELNRKIDKYNRLGIGRFVDFWPWFSHEYFNDVFQAIDLVRDDYNINMNQVHMIRGERRE